MVLTLMFVFLNHQMRTIINPPLLQVQATVVGFLAAVAAVVLGWIPEGKFQMSHAVLLCSSSVATAFIASLLQGKHTHTPSPAVQEKLKLSSSTSYGRKNTQTECIIACEAHLMTITNVLYLTHTVYRYHYGGSDCGLKEDGHQPRQRSHTHCRQFW